MRLKNTALMIGSALLAMLGATQAATFSFSYDAVIVSAGNPITASGTLSVDLTGPVFFTIDSATGTIDGSAITGLDPTGNNVLLGGPEGTNNEFVAFETANGITYSFSLPFGNSTAGDQNLGTFTVSNVPLPASAPLFGAALLALGAVRYGRRRGATA